MVRRAGMLAGFALLVVCAGPARAADTVLGSIAVNGSAQATAVSDVQLMPGVRYRLEVSGTSTVSSGGDGGSYDAFYCFQSSSDQCAQPFPVSAAFNVGLATGSAEPPVEDLAAFAGVAYPAYSGGHTYSVSYTPSVGGRLFLKAWPGSHPDDTVTRSGAFTVTIHGPASAGCPAANQDLTDHGTCDWRAGWAVALDYKPRREELGDDVARLQVKAKGDIEFDRKVKTGKWATGEPSGKFVFILRRRADPNVNGGVPVVVRFHFELVNARVRYQRSGRDLVFDARIEKVKRPPGNSAGCAPGEQATIKMLQRGGRGRDTIEIDVLDGRCLTFSGAGESLRVTLDRPVRI
jgi:hypothetical protein